MDPLLIGVAVVALILTVSVIHARASSAPRTADGIQAMAYAIAIAEGFGIPGAIPTVRNNPGNLKLTGNTITTFPTEAAGWAALIRQLELIRDGRSAYYSPNFTIAEMSRVWVGAGDGPAGEQGHWEANVVISMREQGWQVSGWTPLPEIWG